MGNVRRGERENIEGLLRPLKFILFEFTATLLWKKPALNKCITAKCRPLKQYLIYSSKPTVYSPGDMEPQATRPVPQFDSSCADKSAHDARPGCRGVFSLGSAGKSCARTPSPLRARRRRPVPDMCGHIQAVTYWLLPLPSMLAGQDSVAETAGRAHLRKKAPDASPHNVAVAAVAVAANSGRRNGL